MAEPLDAVEADAKADPEGVVVPLVTDDATDDILILPPAQWFEGAVEALVQGRVSDWVRLAADPEHIEVWESRRKRYGQLEAFLDEWSKRSGESPGKSPRSATGSEENTSSTDPTPKP